MEPKNKAPVHTEAPAYELPCLDASTVPTLANDRRINYAHLGRLPQEDTEERMCLAELYRQCAHLQGPVWQEPSFEWVPPHALEAADHNGGSTLAAYVLVDKNGVVGTSGTPRVLAMAWAFPGSSKQQDETGSASYIYSHLLAVDQRVAKIVSGIGFNLKRLQRAVSIEDGFDEIRWTYDPLETRNASLNVRKLGAITNQYVKNAYLDLQGINEGIPADRFIVQWPLKTARVTKRMEVTPTCIDATTRDAIARAACGTTANRHASAKYRMPSDTILPASERVIAIEVPLNFQEIKAASSEDAMKWRMHTRKVFTNAFAQTYVVRDFALDQQAVLPRGYYLLEKGYTPS